MPIADLKKKSFESQAHYIHYNAVLLFPLKHFRDINRIYFQFSYNAQLKDIILNNLKEFHFFH